VSAYCCVMNWQTNVRKGTLYDEVMVEIRGFALVVLPRSSRDANGHFCASAESETT
jgi:hypothetical protein